MEHHNLSFYQAQYAPSFVDADQAKIDDFFSLGNDTLNTPNIDPEFFTEANLFHATNEKVGLKPTKTDPIVDEFPFINADISLNQQSNSTISSYDRSSNNYSPYSDKQLESSAININSPENTAEMMPVSPNKVCPMDSYAFEDDPNAYIQMAEYEKTLAMYSSPAASSTCNSRSSSISSGSGDNSHNYEYLLNSTADIIDPSQLYRVPQSPASSQYSAESSNITLTNLDNMPSMHLVQIKQEPVDQYPTVIEEFESTGPMYTQMQQPQQQNSYTTLNANDITYYQYQALPNSLPSTVTTILQQQQQQQTVQLQRTTSGQTTPTGGNRKRNANAAFSASTSSGASTSSNKKPRMTKREKQKMMESDITKFENENKDLRQSIDLLERQIQFCKRFLSENVAPVIQRQQQMNQFGSPQMAVAVNEM